MAVLAITDKVCIVCSPLIPCEHFGVRLFLATRKGGLGIWERKATHYHSAFEETRSFSPPLPSMREWQRWLAAPREEHHVLSSEVSAETEI